MVRDPEKQRVCVHLHAARHCGCLGCGVDPLSPGYRELEGIKDRVEARYSPKCVEAGFSEVHTIVQRALVSRPFAIACFGRAEYGQSQSQREGGRVIPPPLGDSGSSAAPQQSQHYAAKHRQRHGSRQG